MNYKNKRVLFLGGFEKMIDVVNAAHEMGIHAIVTDYLTDGPAKKIADESLMYSIDDVDGIVEWCKNNPVDTILNVFVDPAQKPYYEICQRLGLPCFGTKEQFETITDKKLFKQMCKENMVDTIPEYPINTAIDLSATDSEFPVYVKPTDKYASKGQALCFNHSDIEKTIRAATEKYGSKTFIAEKYMGGDDFTIKYRFDHDNIDVIWTADRYLRRSNQGKGTVAIAHGMPSKHTEMYFRNVHKHVCEMFHKMGMKSGIAFLQGFVDEDTIRFYDPAMRFSGGQTYRIVDKVFGTNEIKELIAFSLTGSMQNDYSVTNKEMYLLNGKRGAFLMPTMREGKIAAINGLEKINDCTNVVALTQTHYIGDIVHEDGTAQQRIAYIHIIADSKEELIGVVEWINKTLSVIDTNGCEMLTRDFCPSLLDY